MRGRAAALALAFTACRASSPDLFIPRDGAKSMLLMIGVGGAPKQLIGIDASEFRDVASIPLDAYRDFDLYVLSYSCSLASLGLEPGTIAIADPSTRSGARSLPRADRIRMSGVANGSAAPLVDIDALPQTVEGVRIADPSFTPCVAFDAVPSPIANTPEVRASFGVPLGGDEIFLGLEDGRFFRVTKTGNVPLTALSTSTPHLAAYGSQSGDIWLLGAGGKVASGDLTHGFSPRPSLPVAGEGIRVAGPSGTAPFELFAFSNAEVLERYANGAWTRVAALPAVQGTSIDLTWVGPNEAIAIASTSNAFIDDQSGTTTLEALDPTVLPTAVASIPGFGLVIGADAGVLFHRTNGSFEQLSSDLPKNITAIAPLDDGFICVDRGGGLAQYHPGYGFCTSGFVMTGPAKAIVPVDGGLAIVPGSGQQNAVAVVYLVRRSTPVVTACPVPDKLAP